MIRTLIAILLIVLGIVGIAGGIWGFSLQQESGVDPNLLSAAQTVLGYADSAMTAVDSKVEELTGGKQTLTNLLNDLVGKDVDLTSDLSMKLFAMKNALVILLSGVIGVETGLLLFKWGRR